MEEPRGNGFPPTPTSRGGVGRGRALISGARRRPSPPPAPASPGRRTARPTQGRERLTPARARRPAPPAGPPPRTGPSRRVSARTDLPGQGGPILPAVSPKLVLKRAPRRPSAVTSALTSPVGGAGEALAQIPPGHLHEKWLWGINGGATSGNEGWGLGSCGGLEGTCASPGMVWDSILSSAKRGTGLWEPSVEQGGRGLCFHGMYLLMGEAEY